MAKKAASPKWYKSPHSLTERLKGLRKGMKVQNIVSKRIATATKNIDRRHPYIEVAYPEHGDRERVTVWWVEHVRILQ